MKVAMTGGTGFVGSHAVAALIEAGHEVRLLVRDRARIAAALDPLGVPRIEDVIQGDVTDRQTVEDLLSDCDAVVHAASVYSFDSRDAGQIRETNVDGTRLVLETAHDLGLDPIVHISSIAALFPADEAVGPDSPVASPSGPYAKSKAESERVARDFQDRGAPVVTIAPGSVWGPHDPHFGESCRLASDFLRGQLRSLPRGSIIPIVDVRDVAEVIARVMEPGLGPRRFCAAPHCLTLDELAGTLNRVTGRRVRYVMLPKPLVTSWIGLVSLIQRLLPFRLPLSAEAIRSAAVFGPVDSARAEEQLNISWRAVDETVADTVRTMLADNQLRASAGGVLAAP